MVGWLFVFKDGYFVSQKETMYIVCYAVHVRYDDAFLLVIVEAVVLAWLLLLLLFIWSCLNERIDIIKGGTV